MFSGNSLWSKSLEKIVFLIVAIVLTIVGLLLSQWSFGKVHDMRQLERVPRVPVSAVISGEVNLSGRIQKADQLLQSPDTQTPVVYYRYVVEREEEDSDGDTTWVTVTDESNAVDFYLHDGTSRIRVSPASNVDFDVREDHQRVSGDMRYTEYRLEPRSNIFVFGYASPNAEGYGVRFDRQGSYLPIISEDSALGERKSMALWSALGVWGGLIALSFAVVFLLGVFRVHHSALYLLSVTLVIAGVLLFQGVSMMKKDLEDADEHAARSLEEGSSVIKTALGEHKIEWDGTWGELGSFSEERYEALDAKRRARLARIRLSLAQSVERTNENLSRFPEMVLAPVWGIERVEPLPLPPLDQKKLKSLEAKHEPARLSLLFGVIGLVVGGLGTIFATWKGTQKVGTKRTIENVPTSPIEGVAYGLAEIKGTADFDPEAPDLRGPLSNQACIYYRYVVKRKDSDDDSWSTVRDEERSVPFVTDDGTGRMRVHKKGARFVAKEQKTRRSGNKKYIETRISPGEEVYVLGSAEIDPKTHDRLEITEGHGELPFIVSAYSEEETMYREARTAFYLLNTGLVLTILAGLAFAGTLASFGPILYWVAAAFACVFLFVTLFFLYYNDMIFLRERVDRAWANIDVALKKRFDLINGLQNVVKGYLDHESELQQKLARARAGHQGEQLDPAESDDVLRAEQEARNQILATIEAYPDLKGDQMTTRLMNSLVDVENEIALMRDGYNDSVERYNTRRMKFPEVIIAKMFNFGKASHFRVYEDEAQAPDISSHLAS